MFHYEPKLTKLISNAKYSNSVGDISKPWKNIGKTLNISTFRAKAYFAVGMIYRYISNANAILCSSKHNGFVSAYAILCSGVELLGRCIHKDINVRQNPVGNSGDRLDAGFEYISPSFLPKNIIVETNAYIVSKGGYSKDDLRNLRNMVVHGGVISLKNLKGDIELLHQIRKGLFGILAGESDPHQGAGPIEGALDRFFDSLSNGNKMMCDHLASAAISPIPVQFQRGNWPFDVQLVVDTRKMIKKNLKNNLLPVSGGWSKTGDCFQLYP
jgi:hypothetical protein